MTTSKRVLVLGASGMIGCAIRDAAHAEPTLQLVPGSHRPRAAFVHVDYEALTSPGAWLSILQELKIDAVVNCVGIWSGSAEEFELVQYTVPVALFDACNSLAIQVVHLSALGFAPESPLPYASTKARADRYLLASCRTGTVVYPSLVFGSDGDSTRFFLDLAALPIQVDFGFPQNLQPVHVREVAQAVVAALTSPQPPQKVECAGTHVVSVPEYFEALRTGMGLRAPMLTLRMPAWFGRLVFSMGELLGAHFVNRQTWTLLKTGTRSASENPTAIPYREFATPSDLRRVRDVQLYWFARLGVAFIWLWTAIVTLFYWPRSETLAWLKSLSSVLGTPFWMVTSCVLDAAMGVASLVWPSKRLWLAQFALTAAYTVGMATSLPWTWTHPLGPLTKNLTVLFAMLYLATHESRRRR